MRAILACVGACTACAVAHAGFEPAKDLFWTALGSGSWFDPANWSEPRVPNAFDTVVFKLEAEYEVVCGVPATVNELRIRQGLVTFILPGVSIASLSTAGALSSIIGEGAFDDAYARFREGRFQPVGVTLGFGELSQGTAAFAGSLARFLPTGEVVVGLAGDGTIAFENGARAQILNLDTLTTLGAAPTGSGAISLFGTNTRWSSVGKLIVGDEGVGSINMGDGAALITGETRIAVAPGSSGSIQILDASATINGDLFLGFGDGGAARVSVGGQSLLTAHTVRIGALSSLSGDAVVRADVLSYGAIRPGDLSIGAPTPSVLTIEGDLTMRPGASLVIELGPTPLEARATDADRLHVSGHARLDGSLIVDLFFGAEPALGDRFEIVTAASRSGRFDALLAPALEEGLSWRVRYSDSGAQIRVVPAPGPAALAILAPLLALRRRRR